MSSPSSVITLGFGSWGSVNLLPTLGYSSLVSSNTGPGRLEYTIPRSTLEFAVPLILCEFTLPKTVEEFGVESP